MKATWGFQGRFHYGHLDIGNSNRLGAVSHRVTDNFPLDGVIPPLAPYNGSFTGPGPLMGADPVRSEVFLAGGASVFGSRDLEADLFALSAGPWLALPVNERLTLHAEAGLTLAVIDGSYEHRSLTVLPGASASYSADGSETSVLPGFYAGLSAFYALNEQWDVYAHGRYQYLDDFSVRAGSSRAELIFDESFVVSLGVRFKF